MARKRKLRVVPGQDEPLKPVPSTIMRRPPKSLPHPERRPCDYVLDPKLLHAFVSGALPYTRTREGDIHVAHRQYLRSPNHRDELLTTSQRLYRTCPLGHEHTSQPQRSTAWSSGDVAPTRWPASHICWRTQSERPHFQQRLNSTIHTSVGRQIVLTVRVRSEPLCTVNWFKNERPITVRPRRTRTQTHCVEIRTDGPEVHSVCIDDAVESDSGVYTCRAENCAGRVETSTFVDVATAREPSLPVRLYGYGVAKWCSKEYYAPPARF